MQTKIILLVDDEDGVRRVMAMLLRRWGYSNILEAENGEEGIRMIKEHNPTLVITDLTMSDMRGEELISWVVREYKPTFPQIKVMAVSGDGLPDTEAKAMAAGGDMFLAKPYNLPDLKTAVEGLLA